MGDYELIFNIHVNKQIKHTSTAKFVVDKSGNSSRSVRVSLKQKDQLSVEIIANESKNLSFSIFNGTEASALVRGATVSLTYGSGGKSLCSGAVLCDGNGSISPESVWILTAGHCLTPSFAVLGDNGYAVEDRCSLSGVAVAHPNMMQRQASVGPVIEHDIAVAKFSCPAGFIAKAKCAMLPSAPMTLGVPLIVSGYGKMGQNPPGVLQQTSFTTAAISGVAGGNPTFNELVSDPAGGRLVATASGTGICSGDSGGPSFVEKDGRLTVVGVHSGGNCEASFSVLSDALVFAHLDWIYQTTGFVKSNGSLPPVTMTNPTSPGTTQPSGNVAQPSTTGAQPAAPSAAAQEIPAKPAAPAQVAICQSPASPAEKP